MNLLSTGIPLSLYIHIPWCVEKCPYCDFNSHKVTGQIEEQTYVNSLLTDLEQDLPAIWGRKVESIFIGGGTPSLFSGFAINQLLSGVRARLMLQANIEITLESNPGTTDANNYSGYREAGVNRLSIGVQSFNNQHLTELGRIHNSQQAIDAFLFARKAGFERINLDLMFGLPNQTLTQAMDDLDKAIALEPEHISWYQLTIEKNTVFSQTSPNLPDDDLIWKIQQQGMEKLNLAGFEQYEISAWSKTKEQCLHNINYWQFGDYLGIGAGAHGKITDLTTNSISRSHRKKQPHHWLKSGNKTRAQLNCVNKKELPLEFMMNILRLNAGVPVQFFSQRTGLALSQIAEPLEQARQLGLITNQPQMIRATEQGMNYLNDLLNIFMSDSIIDQSTNLTKNITIREIE